MQIENKINDQQAITPQYILSQLETRVTEYNAKMILKSALVSTGLDATYTEALDKDQSHSLCLALIKKGGPAFQVGTEIYRKYLKN